MAQENHHFMRQNKAHHTHVGHYGRFFQASKLLAQKCAPSVPPLRWAQNRRFAVNEPSNFLAFPKIATELASPNLLAMQAILFTSQWFAH